MMLAVVIFLLVIIVQLMRIDEHLGSIQISAEKLDWRNRKRFPILPGEQEDEDLANEMEAWQRSARK